MADRSRILGTVVALVCYVVALNVIASAAHVHPWLGVALLTVLALSATTLTGTARPRNPNDGRHA